MASTSVAQLGTETITEDLEHSSGIATRVLRGQRLYREYTDGFIHKRGTWYVPSENSCSYYACRLGPVEVCECSDYTHRGGPCKHLHAATIAHAKSSVCSCCGHRVLNRHLTEVVEADSLFGWFPGDMLCEDCVGAGYWG